MDCRKPLLLALGLATGCLGCLSSDAHKKDHPGGTIPPAASATAVPAKTPAAAVTLTPEEPGGMKKPKASTEAAYGNFRGQEAQAPNLTAPQREAMQDEARKAFQRALQLDPSCLLAYSGLGGLYLSMGEYDRAVVTYREGLQKYPREASLWFDLGMCHSRRKDWKAGIECMQQAHLIDPENRTYTKTLGLTLARAGRSDESLACLRKVVGEAEAHVYLARMLHHLGQDELSKQQLQVALETNPNLRSARELLGELEQAGNSPRQPVVNIGFDTRLGDPQPTDEGPLN